MLIVPSVSGGWITEAQGRKSSSKLAQAVGVEKLLDFCVNLAVCGFLRLKRRRTMLERSTRYVHRAGSESSLSQLILAVWKLGEVV